MRLTGRVWKFGPHIDTDTIIPARYLAETDTKKLAEHVMETVDPDFAKKVREGDIIVAGPLFGMGSSREHAPIAIKGAGISAVIAPSFARIFQRNAINVGLPVLESASVYEETREGDELEIDLATGSIVNKTTGKTYQASTYPEFMLGIIQAGGLVPYTKQKLAGQRS